MSVTKCTFVVMCKWLGGRCDTGEKWTAWSCFGKRCTATGADHYCLIQQGRTKLGSGLET